MPIVSCLTIQTKRLTKRLPTFISGTGEAIERSEFPTQQSASTLDEYFGLYRRAWNGDYYHGRRAELSKDEDDDDLDKQVWQSDVHQ
jgi:hypothetical protein